MRIFVTGATGFVGSAIVQELLGAGYEVLGLTRSEEGAQKLAAAGAQAHFGTLEDLGSLQRGAADADGVIHTAFIHDFTQYAAAAEADQRAIQAIGTTLAGSNRPFIITSGFASLVKSGDLMTEDDTRDPNVRAMRLSEDAALQLVEQGVRATVVRLAASVHDKGDHGFVPMLIQIARTTGVSAYISEGLNRWPAVHRLDAARLYRLVLEQGVAGGRYHGVADEGVPFRDIAGAIGRHLNVPVVSKSADEAATHFGWMGNFARLDLGASSALTQQRLGWQITQPGLLADLEHGDYFAQ